MEQQQHESVTSTKEAKGPILRIVKKLRHRDKNKEEKELGTRNSRFRDWNITIVCGSLSSSGTKGKNIRGPSKERKNKEREKTLACPEESRWR